MIIPFFTELEPAQTVLIAGAGGGFDIYCGLPLYHMLRAQGKTVHLANLSFTDLDECQGERPVPALLTVRADTAGPSRYFPEVYLARWIKHRYGGEPCIHAIERTGARPVQAAYDWLCATLGVDTLILIDGGTDILMRGDEAGLGTPEEDIASLAAADAVTGPQRKLIACLGFGVDSFHGVSHALFLENVAALIEAGGYLGCWSLTREMEEFRAYQEACQFAHQWMTRLPSIVNTSINAAIEGHFGNHHATRRTHGSELFINPLMGLYWGFLLEQVARQNLYLDRIRATSSYPELTREIEIFRHEFGKRRPARTIPC